MAERHPTTPHSEYGFLSEQPYYPVRYSAGGTPAQDEVKWRSLEEVEFRTIRDTLQLIEALDGSDEDPTGKRYLHGERRFDGPCEAAIYLDKSARPVRALVKELWNDVSSAPIPEASFLNIDKIDYLLDMGYSMRDIKERHIPTDEVDINKIPTRDRVLRTAEIRALYLTDRTRLAEVEQDIEAVRRGTASHESLLPLWQMETRLDGKHVAVVDEVRSSGATVAVAEQLLEQAFPEARFEPMFWSMPPTFTYEVMRDGESVTKLADTEKPLWYDGDTSAGRGGIGGKDIERSGRSTHVAQRIGRHVLGVPYHVENEGRYDTPGYRLRKDFKLLARKWRDGQVKPPSRRT